MEKVSTKISLSLPSMLAASRSVVACSGKSAKAPLGKAEAMVRGLEAEGESAMSFPASALRHAATWLLDEDSAVLLRQRRASGVREREGGRMNGGGVAREAEGTT